MIGRMVLSRNMDEAMVLRLVLVFFFHVLIHVSASGGVTGPIFVSIKVQEFFPGRMCPALSFACFASCSLALRSTAARALPGLPGAPPSTSSRGSASGVSEAWKWLGKMCGKSPEIHMCIYICIFIYIYICIYIYIHTYILAKRLVSCQCSLELIEVEKSTESWGST